MQALLRARREMARELVAPILAGVARKDTGHAAFHGCVDWHSAVHGVWALTAYARMTGDTVCDGLLEETLRPEKLAAERALLAARPGFEMPYGRAWFLRLAIDHERVFKDRRLAALADEAAQSLMTRYQKIDPDPLSTATSSRQLPSVSRQRTVRNRVDPNTSTCSSAIGTPLARTRSTSSSKSPAATASAQHGPVAVSKEAGG